MNLKDNLSNNYKKLISFKLISFSFAIFYKKNKTLYMLHNKKNF